MAKNHNYTNLVHGEDFNLEVANDGITGDMIGQGKMRVGDYITISATKYRVIQIEYYADPPDMWRAKLSLVSSK